MYNMDSIRLNCLKFKITFKYVTANKDNNKYF